MLCNTRLKKEKRVRKKKRRKIKLVGRANEKKWIWVFGEKEKRK